MNSTSCNKIRLTPLLYMAVLCLSLLLSACGGQAGSKSTTMNAASPAYQPESKMTSYEGTGAITTASSQEKPLVSELSNLPDASARKLIKNMRITMETQEFEDSVQKIKELVMLQGGYIESSSVNGVELGSSRYRTASYTIRIPADKLEQAEAALSGMGNITNSVSEVSDISMTYADTSAKIAALKAQQTSLLNMMEKADNISDMLEIREQLAKVEYELESHASRLRVMDNQVAYSSLHLSLKEVKLYTEKTEEPQGFFQRVGQVLNDTLKGLKNFFENTLIFLLGRLPVILLLAALVVPLALFIRKQSRKANARAASEKKEDEDKPAELKDDSSK